MVYIQEAHPTDGWQVESNRNESVEYAQPQTLGARKAVAGVCALGLKMTIPMLIDTMDNAADRAFNGWPERLYVLSADGRVVYQGGKGPYGFDPSELADFLKGYLSPTDGPAAQGDGKA